MLIDADGNNRKPRASVVACCTHLRILSSPVLKYSTTEDFPADPDASDVHRIANAAKFAPLQIFVKFERWHQYQ